MGKSIELSRDEFLDQYSYVSRVVKGCKTEEQLQNAKRWAEDWAWRMKKNVPSLEIQSATDLYLSVIE
jgi:hypothetical protein